MSTTVNTFRPEGYIDQQKQHVTVIQWVRNLYHYMSSDAVGRAADQSEIRISWCIIGDAIKSRGKYICHVGVYSKLMTIVFAAGTAISKFMYVSL